MQRRGTTLRILVHAVILALSLILVATPQADAVGGSRGQRGGPQRYSLEQAVSDQAQLHTIAFNSLAFMTGDFGASTFIPPGRAG